MPRVQFYHNAENPLALACELTARACAGGRKVALRAPDPATARRLDQMLWSFDPLAFVPHVDTGSALAARTPVLIGCAGDAPDWSHHDLLFNLAPDVPAELDAFRSVVEIVGQDEADKTPARTRWMHYKQLGLDIKAFDAVSRERL